MSRRSIHLLPPERRTGTPDIHDSRLWELASAAARTVDVEHAFRELAHSVRQIVPYESMLVTPSIAATAGEPLLPALRSGLEPGQGLAAVLADSAREAVRTAAIAERQAAGVSILSAPIVDTGAPAAATLTLILESASGAQLANARAALEIAASQLSAARHRALLLREAREQSRFEAAGEVAAGLANELRHPLFGIASAAQLLRFRAQTDLVVERNVGRILREVERLNTLGAQLLDYGRSRDGDIRPCDPDDLWDEVLASSRGLLESASLVLLRTRAEPPAECELDRERVLQLFRGLLEDAVHAAPPGTDIGLRAGRQPQAWFCALRNSGHPISPDALPHVFDLFPATGRSERRLALARRIVEEHAGTIQLESIEAGTTVTITLPSA